MDFNDVKTKLDLLSMAVKEQYEVDVANNIKDDLRLANGEFEINTTFGSNSATKNQALVMNAIHSIAVLKETIKEKLKSSGKDPQLYERLIDDNQELALVTDLDNMNKHGAPLTKSNRSGKQPKIIDIHQALRGQGITNAKFTTDLTTGKTKLISKEGNIKVIVTASITDSEMSLLMPLHQMLEESVRIIRAFVKQHDL